jgi:hypothetical protein
MTPALLDRPGTLFTDAAERPGGERSGGERPRGERPAEGERPAGERPAGGERPGGAGPALPGGRATLEDLLSATLHEAQANGSAECPVCHARLTYTRAGEAQAGQHALAECGGCGSRLG